MLKSLTKKEKEILDYIKISTQIHGYSPSLIEIRDHFRLNAVSTVHEHISNLKRKGYILKEVSQARSIKIVDTDPADKQFIEIPISFELYEENILRTSIGRDSIFVHNSNLKEEGRHFAIKINTLSYTNAGINKHDVLVIRECEELGFTATALISIGQNYFLGEIIENKQLPAFKKFLPDKALILKFKIEGEIVLLHRNYSLSLK
jgi:repressor LexA